MVGVPSRAVRVSRPVTFAYRLPRWKVRRVERALSATVVKWEYMAEISHGRSHLWWADCTCTVWLPATLGRRERDRLLSTLSAVVQRK